MEPACSLGGTSARARGTTGSTAAERGRCYRLHPPFTFAGTRYRSARKGRPMQAGAFALVSAASREITISAITVARYGAIARN